MITLLASAWWTDAWAAAGLLVLASALGAWLLRRAGAPGAAILGGMVAGFVLGPTILGRALPAVHDRLFVGGLEQRHALNEIESKRGGVLAVADARGLDDATRKASLADWDSQYRAAEDAWRAARLDHQRPLRILTWLTVALSMLGAAAVSLAGRNGRSAAAGATQSALATSAEASWPAAASIGLGAALLPGCLACVAAALWGDSASQRAFLAAAVAIGPWVLAPGDRLAADQAEVGGARLIELAGRVASIIAVIMAAIAMWTEHGLEGLVWMTPLAGLILAWPIADRAVALGLAPISSGTVVRRMAAATSHLLVPTLAALVAVRIELLQHFSPWPIVVLGLLSGDGRWLGALLGALLPGGRAGPRTFRTMRLVLGACACGPTQLALAAIGLWSGLLKEQVVYGLLIGAALVEVMTPVRVGMAQRLVEAEQEVQALDDEVR